MLARKRKSVCGTDKNGEPKDKGNPLESMLDMLKCSKCDQLPRDGKVWISAPCVHKYCKSCIQKSRQCVTCEIAITPRDRILDDFTTNLLSELLRFQQMLNQEKKSTKEESATGAMKENIEEQTDDIVFMKEAEAPVLEKCDSKEEKGGRKSRTSLSALFGLSEEDEVMEEELDPDLPALTPHPPSPEKKPLSQKSKNKVKSKNPTVLLDRLVMPEKEQIGTKKSSGRQLKKLITMDDATDDDDSIFGTPNSRSSRRSARRRSPSTEKPERKVEVESSRKSKRQKKFFPERESESRDSSNNSRERIVLESAKQDRGRINVEESDGSVASTRRSKKINEEDNDDAPSPAKSDIYEFKSQSTKPKPKTMNRQQQRRRKDSDSSATSSSIVDSPKPEKKHEFVKPPPRSISTSGSDIVKDVKSSPSASNVNKKNAKGETPLHIAVRNGKLEKVKELVAAGADVDAKDYAGWTPLHEAICAKVPSLDMVKFLVTSGADVHALGLNNSTPLHEASRRGLKLIVKYLLSESASPALRTSEGKLPIDLAKDAAVRKVFTEWEKKSVNQSQSTQISVELKISLQNAMFFFDYNPEKDFLRNCQQLLDIKVSKELSKEVTHVVFDAKPKSKVPLSFNYIVSILNGCWMLSSKWLEDSLDVKRFLDPNLFQIGGCQYENIPSSNGGTCDSAVERARINREHGNPSLFNGFNFYMYKNSSWAINNDGAKEKKGEEKKGSGGGKKLSLSGHSSCVFNKKDLAKLIAFGDGTVINREPNPDMVDPLESPERFHAAQHNKTPHKLCLTSHVVLYDDKNVPPNKYDMEHVKTMKTDWLIHSAVHFKLLMPDSYLE